MIWYLTSKKEGRRIIFVKIIFKRNSNDKNNGKTRKITGRHMFSPTFSEI